MNKRRAATPEALEVADTITRVLAAIRDRADALHGEHLRTHGV